MKRVEEKLRAGTGGEKKKKKKIMPGEKKAQGHLLNMNKYPTGEWFKKGWNQTLLSGIQQMDKRPLEQIKITEIPHKHKKIL